MTLSIYSSQRSEGNIVLHTNNEIKKHLYHKEIKRKSWANKTPSGAKYEELETLRKCNVS